MRSDARPTAAGRIALGEALTTTRAVPPVIRASTNAPSIVIVRRTFRAAGSLTSTSVMTACAAEMITSPAIGTPP